MVVIRERRRGEEVLTEYDHGADKREVFGDSE